MVNDQYGLDRHGTFSRYRWFPSLVVSRIVMGGPPSQPCQCFTTTWDTNLWAPRVVKPLTWPGLPHEPGAGKQRPYRQAKAARNREATVGCWASRNGDPMENMDCSTNLVASILWIWTKLRIAHFCGYLRMSPNLMFQAQLKHSATGATVATVLEHSSGVQP